MPEIYLGHLPHHDPLYGYLRWEIFPQLGSDCRDGIRVFGTNGSNAVYIYEDRQTCRKVVGKFFFSDRMRDWDAAYRRMEREYRNILEFRSYLSGCHYVARPLGRNADLNRLLVVEHCSGESLDSVINRAIAGNDASLLYQKLAALAWFLAEVHNRSAGGRAVDFNYGCHYFNMMVRSLENVLHPGEAEYFYSLQEQWRQCGFMAQDNEVLVHGDATPANFFFGDDKYVISFDLERVKRTDRCFDVGRIAGELQYYFIRLTGNKYAAEPFIGSFLWEYTCHFPDRERAFAAITARIPFYLGTTLLRIARNGYLDMRLRRQLVEEAKLCLRK